MRERDYGTNKTEQSIINQIGGTPHRNSGRGMKKGDGTYYNFTIDVKECRKNFTLSTDVWSKACTDALSNKNDPMLLVVFNGQTRLAVVELAVLEQLLENQK